MIPTYIYFSLQKVTVVWFGKKVAWKEHYDFEKITAQYYEPISVWFVNAAVAHVILLSIVTILKLILQVNIKINFEINFYL